jgi:hypothetical protein
MGCWRGMNNEELCYLYACFTREVGWAGHVAHMGVMGNAYKILAGIPEGKIPFGRLRYRLEDSRLDLRETGWEVVD